MAPSQECEGEGWGVGDVREGGADEHEGQGYTKVYMQSLENVPGGACKAEQ